MRNKTFSRRIRAKTGKKYTKKYDVRAKLLFFLLNLLLLLLLCFFFFDVLVAVHVVGPLSL